MTPSTLLNNLLSSWLGNFSLGKIDHVFCTPYHPQEQVILERTNRSLKALLTKFTLSEAKWDPHLTLVEKLLHMSFLTFDDNSLNFTHKHWDLMSTRFLYPWLGGNVLLLDNGSHLSSFWHKGEIMFVFFFKYPQWPYGYQCRIGDLPWTILKVAGKSDSSHSTLLQYGWVVMGLLAITTLLLPIDSGSPK